jgi:uncharacterized protein (TIGR03437 family)
MKRGISVLALSSVLAALSSVPATAYYHFIYYFKSGNTPAKFDLTALPNKTVQFFVSETGPSSYGANDSFASVVTQVRQATAVWNSVASSNLRVAFGGLENANTKQNTPAGDVVFEDLPPGLLGYGGPSINTTQITPSGGTPFVAITRSTVHLNRNLTIAPGPSYNESFFMTVVHEMGHALGLQHTFTSSTMSTATTRSTSLAHPLDDDDIAGISVLYPNASFPGTGSITGRITSGGSGVHLASVVAMRPGTGAISALTSPDGTYRIDGIPQGSYYVYAHPLPPDADIQGPWYADGSHPDGTVAAASGPTNALLYPGTMNLDQAQPVSVVQGKTASGVDIALTSRDSVPVYDASVYGYFNNYTIAVKPAYVNIMAPSTPTVVAAGIGFGANGQATSGLSARFAGGSAIVSGGNIRPYQANGFTYVAMDIAFMLGAQPGPQHLIFSTPDFMHILPSAVRLTTQDPPSVKSVSPNADGTLTIAATNLVAGSAVYFDGVPAGIVSLDVKAGKAIVTAPPGTSGQTAILTVFNPDGQNSQFVQSATPVTYTYGNSPTPVISSISPAYLPAGSEAIIDITGSGLNLVDGQTTVGFGSSDVLVRHVFVLGPNHLQADVSVAAGATLSNPDVSILTGFQTATATAGFKIAARVNGLPALIPDLTNALPGLNGQYAGAIVAVYGANLAAPNASPVVTFNGEAAAILYSSANQINLQIPADLTPGLVVMKVNNGLQDSFPLVVNIDTQPATIKGIQNGGGNVIGPSNPAVQGDLLVISLSGFAPDGSVISSNRVQILVGGIMHSSLPVTQPSPGIFQVSVSLSQNEPTGKNQPVIVYLDGRSSYPASIPITTTSGSF